MKKIICILLIIVLFSGCEFSTEPDSKSFVTAIGIDKGDKYELRMTFVFASATKDSQHGSSDDNDPIVIEAPSIYSAIEQMNAFKSKTIEFSHTKTVIFSDELAKEGIEEYVYALVRSNNFRPNTYICIAKDSSMKFLENIKPVETYHLEKYFSEIFQKRSTGDYSEMYLYHIYFDLLSANKASILPYCAINEHMLQGDENNEEPSESQSEKPSESEEPTDIGGKFAENTDDFASNSIAGGIMRKGKNPAEIHGMAVLKQGVYISALGYREAMITQSLNEGMSGGYIAVSNPYKENEIIDLYVTQIGDGQIKVNTDNDPEISIRIKLEGDYAEVGKNAMPIENPREFEEYFSQKCEEAIMKLLLKSRDELGCDIFSFSEKAKGNFTTVKDWDNYNWDERYKSASFTVDVDITMRAYGELAEI